ncbi:methylmalonyl-CoA carboxyltransferase [candidate division KSB3 bacterium]|uniref:Methylmalonyl-CoA carboxyltransferase n=1 Tax=candidate division KSB3 bacterium TaxID=2044937 RepID=A0A2G6E2K8_9BACT|nr:MAG: methylmalonyl-CoA carboxyltransferase [candidate division KSB3 bacterium]PIE28853.1 MAG: methylmalonyl-CoA carboxyltransferase [candidate division KSB3 bacterium]
MESSHIERLINDLEQKQKSAMAGGGEERIKRQHEMGKCTARERLSMLFDPKSFVELDCLVEHRCSHFGMEKVSAPCDGVVTGYGLVNGRLTYAFAQDFTVIGGSLGEMHAKKITKLQDLAVKMGAPIIGINDSGGARIQEGIDSLFGYGEIFFRNTRASGVIPQISVIAGPCAGGAVYSPALTDFVFMEKGSARMFITGPGVIKSVTGEDVSAEALGGAMAHNQLSGNAHFACDSEEELFQTIRYLLSFLPQNNMEDAPTVECRDSVSRLEESLVSIVPTNPNKPYDVRDVITAVVDHGEFLDIQKYFAQNIVVGFARMQGRTIGIIANQAQVMAGCLDINASDKAARFVRFCDAFNIPLLTVVDTPGYLPGTAQEHGGVIRHGAKLLYAYSEATVPKVTLIVRKAYGGAYIAMCSRHLGADMVMAWPQAEIAVMGAEGAANIIFRRDINAADKPEEKRQEKIAEYRETFSNPYQAAQRGYVDRVIHPIDTRPALISAFDMAANKRERLPKKKHANIPL